MKSSCLKMILVLVLLDLGNLIMSSPIGVLSKTELHRPETWNMLGIWPMTKQSFFLTITGCIAVITFLSVLIFGLVTFFQEAEEFDELRLKNQIESQKYIEALEMQLQPSSRKSGEECQICQTAAVEALNSLPEALRPIIRSKSVEELKPVAEEDILEKGDSVSLN